MKVRIKTLEAIRTDPNIICDSNGFYSYHNADESRKKFLMLAGQIIDVSFRSNYSPNLKSYDCRGCDFTIPSWAIEEILED